MRIILFLLISVSCFGQANRMQMWSVMTTQSDRYSKIVSKGNSLGIRTPTGDIQNAQRTFINSLVSNGIWSKGDILKVFNNSGKKDFTDLNWISPQNNISARTTNPKWNAYEGLSSNGVDNYVDLNWKPSNGVNFTQNSNESIIYARDIPFAFNSGIADGSRTATGSGETDFNAVNASNTIAARSSSSSSTSTITDTQFDLTNGLYFWGRTSLSSEFAKKNSGSRITNNNSSSSPPAQNFTLGAINTGGSISNNNSKTFGLFWSGGLLTTTDESNFLSAWNTYLSSVAATQAKYVVGTIYNKSSWTNLSDFTNNGSTCSVVSNQLSFSGGAGTFTQSLDLTTPTKLSKWSINAQVKITASGNGFGFGIRSSNVTNTKVDALARVSGTSGQLIINVGNSHTQGAASSSNVSFSINDVLNITVTLNEDVLAISGNNVTTGGPTVAMNYVYPSSGTFLPNTGRFAIYSFGGSFTVQSLTISSNETVNPLIAVLGDSKSQYYQASQQHKSWGYEVKDLYNKGEVVINAGGYDGSGDYVAHLNDLTNFIKPKYVIIAGISNDIRFGISSATWQSNLSTIYSTLTGAGITPIFTDGLYETSISQAAVTTWMSNTANIPAANYLATNTTTLSLYTDNVHPVDAGHLTYANLILASGKLP